VRVFTKTDSLEECFLINVLEVGGAQQTDRLGSGERLP
jgi:hypothetical protein